ncbi:MAG: hypothetical protein KA735_08855 [Burkholderiaceae bacterium]|nr:hypothetical protein [Burkholderiaceae bacterium]
MPANLVFTTDEIDLLGRTADALSAYMGKPVLAQVMDATETGFEWVVFAVPLQPQDKLDDFITVEVGGNGARLLGNKGGLDMAENEVFDCEYLWAIQLSELEGARFIKVDLEGDEVGWTDSLQDLLPFAMVDEPISDDLDDDNDTDQDDPQADAPDLPANYLPPSDQLH